MGAPPRRSGFSQQKVDRPAPSHMLALRPAVAEEVLVLAPRFFEGVGQHRHVRKVAGVVHPPGHRDGQAVVPAEPGRVDDDGAERVAEDVADQRSGRLHLGWCPKDFPGLGPGRHPGRYEPLATAGLLGRPSGQLRVQSAETRCWRRWQLSETPPGRSPRPSEWARSSGRTWKVTVTLRPWPTVARWYTAAWWRRGDRPTPYPRPGRSGGGLRRRLIPRRRTGHNRPC